MNTENQYIETDLGNIAPNPRGEYDPGASYEYLDLVEYAGGSFLCLAELGTTITDIAPAQGRTTAEWQRLAIPGNLTPEYIAMHDDVVNKAAETAENTKVVQNARENVIAMENNVQLRQSQTAQDAEKAEQSKDSAAGYALTAERSRQYAQEAEENIRMRVGTVDEIVNAAKEEIDQARQSANAAVVTQQETSTQAIKNAESDAKTEISRQTEDSLTYITQEADFYMKGVYQEAGSYVEQANASLLQTAQQGVADIQNEGAARLAGINKAGTDNAALVEGVGTAQVQSIQQEGDTQIQNVQAAAAEIQGDRGQIAKNTAALGGLSFCLAEDGGLDITIETEGE